MSAVIRGMGAVSAAGVGVPALLELLRAGRTAIRPVTRFPTDTFDVHTAALVPGYDTPPMGPGLDGRPQAVALAFGRLAAREALAQAGPWRGAGEPVTALVIGTNLEDRPEPLDVLFGALADELGVDGPRLVMSLACASGTAALGHALELLDRGDADRVIVGGVDAVSPRVYAGFWVLGALAERAAPFSEPAGMSVGDGAAFLVLERAAGHTDETCVLGYGLAADAFHDTRPAPDGRGVAAAVRAALGHAGLPPDAITYVNAHGTGTEANDAAEWRGIRAGLDGREPPTSSLKGLIGHAQGAAGALEVALTLACRAEGLLPPTIGFGVPRPGAPPDPVPVLRRGSAHTFLSTSSAFGGANAAVIVGAGRPVDRPRLPVCVAGVGLWGPAGGGRAQPPEGEPPLPGLAALPRGVDPDALEAPTVWLCAAIGQALDAAGVRLSRALRPKVGLVLGMRTALARDGRALEQQIDTHGPAGVTGSTFARALIVAPAGAAATALGLLGPLDVVVAGSASGGHALVHAATLLAERPELAFVIAATLDDLDTAGRWAGATAVLLGRAGVPVRGWALAATAERAAANAERAAANAERAAANGERAAANAERAAGAAIGAAPPPGSASRAAGAAAPLRVTSGGRCTGVVAAEAALALATHLGPPVAAPAGAPPAASPGGPFTLAGCSASGLAFALAFGDG